MDKLTCKGCREVMDIKGIPPFTLCECSNCNRELIIPFKLNHILLEELIETQSGVDIYSGFDQSSNFNITAMLIDQDEPDSKKLTEIAKDEAKKISSLKHVNICPVLNFSIIKGNLCVISPKMDGYSLNDYNPKEQGLLNITSVIEILQAAALGLAIAHHNSFIHHNICTKNIHIDARGNVRIKNFFISRLTYTMAQIKDEKSSNTNIDESISPYFISPEKAESGIEDMRGDVFSFGVVLYFLLTGKYPFQGKDALETVYSRIQQKKRKKIDVFDEGSEKNNIKNFSYIAPTAPKKLRDEIPEHLSQLIIDMLSYLPIKRPKLSEVLSTFNHIKAEKAKKDDVGSAQKEMVTTKTRAIPKMTPLTAPTPKKKKKWGF